MRPAALPPPQTDLPFPLMKALQMRRSRRRWTEEPISCQDLSNLLWAAGGISREGRKRAKSRRTAPSASNAQAVRIYAALKTGLFLYDETGHRLLPVLHEDIRKYIGTQKMMHSAPLGLIYVADFSRMKVYAATDTFRKWFVSGTDTGFMSQNVYLYCAAAGLSTVVLGLVDREELHTVMGLKPHEQVLYTQVVGKSPAGT